MLHYDIHEDARRVEAAHRNGISDILYMISPVMTLVTAMLIAGLIA